MTDTITLGSLLGSLITIITVLSALYMNGRKIRRESSADMQARDEKLAKDARERTDELKLDINRHNENLEKRLGAVEAKIVDFMPRTEIEAKIEHEKGNRTQADNSLKERLDANTRDIVDIKVSVGRLDQKQDGLASDMSELKGLLKDFSRDVNAKLDKQQECLNSISRKAA